MMSATEKSVYDAVKAVICNGNSDTEKLNRIAMQYGYDLYIKALNKVSEEMAGEKDILELWQAACSGDIEALKDYYISGGKPNRRYYKFGKYHSLIAGAYRNGNIDTVKYLYTVGEVPEDYEREEVKYSPFGVVIVHKSGEERIPFSKEENARKIFYAMRKIATENEENIISVILEKEGRSIFAIVK